MASIEDRLEQVEHALTRMGQMQEQGQVRLEQALKRAEGLIGSAGEAVAGAVQASAGEVAKAHRAALVQAVEEVAVTSRQAVAEASGVIQELRKAIQEEGEASRRAAVKEQQLEAALDALLPKVAAVQEGLEKKLGGMVNATAATEGEVRGLVATMKANLTKEIETEVRAKLREAADHAADRVYGLMEWWERFTRVGIPAVLALFVVVSGGLGWWFGKHQLEADTYQQAMERLRVNARVTAWGMKPNFDTEGHLMGSDAVLIKDVLVPVGNGKWEAMAHQGEDWYFRGVLIPGAKGFSIAEAYDSTRKEDNLIKAYKP